MKTQDVKLTTQLTFFHILRFGLFFPVQNLNGLSLVWRSVRLGGKIDPRIGVRNWESPALGWLELNAAAGST
jgi:hypothetical protein